MKKLLILCLLVFSSFSVVACGSETKSEPDAVPMKPATAVFETSMGDFEVKLATDLAPKTCENFIIRNVGRTAAACGHCKSDCGQAPCNSGG